MNEEKDIKKDDYTVQELIKELLEDDSWEPDLEYRKKAVGMLFMSIFPVC